MRINTSRLWNDLQALGVIGRNPQDGSVSRIAFSPEDMEGRAFVKKLMDSAGMAVEEDAVGNVIGHLRGGHDLCPIAIGSHVDTVPQGGRFDGALGILAGIECARVIRECKYELRHPLRIIVFSDEEGYRFGRGTLGSRALSGFLNPDDLHILKDARGETVWQVLEVLGFEPSHVSSGRKLSSDLLAYLELHIEQGPVLDSLNVPIGIVDTIAGILRYEFRVEGEANHAGTTPMAYRKDALFAAAAIVGIVKESVLRRGGDVVGTVGKFEVLPGAPNIVPGTVVMTTEFRGPSQQVLEELAEEILKQGQQEVHRSGVMLKAKETVRIEPTPMHPEVMQAIEVACQRTKIPYRTMNSGAGHDAIWMAKAWPTGMIFVPSLRGVSHASGEFTDEPHVGLGAQVLLEALMILDRYEGDRR